MAKRINADIERFNLLPMSQFGSRPHHSTIDAMATLVHKIQGMRATGHAGALLLFDISGFFDNINPGQAIQILHNKGFPTNVCDWALSFLTGHTVLLKIGTYELLPFPILNGTPRVPCSRLSSPLYMLPPRQAAKLSRCGCDPSWFCSPHDACFIHESCLCEGSSKWPPVKPVHSRWVSESREWLSALLSRR
jgi:hypothetical protein